MSCHHPGQAKPEVPNIKIYVYRVAMSCEGCCTAIHKVLSKHKDKGIQNVEIDMPGQQVKVTVNGDLSANDVLELIRRTGKNVEYITPQFSFYIIHEPCFITFIYIIAAIIKILQYEGINYFKQKSTHLQSFLYSLLLNIHINSQF